MLSHPFFLEVQFIMQSTGQTQPNGMHVAIIMDGNGRWARSRGLPRSAGHRAGSEAVSRTVEAARKLGVGTLTLYAFSSDNWQRPNAEVALLMALFREYLLGQRGKASANGIRINVIGRRDRLPRGVLDAVEEAERWTLHCSDMRLRIAVDYSARASLVEAARLAAASGVGPEDDAAFGALIDKAIHASRPSAPVDLLIRTSGEQRLSDFLLWESAYAELVFLETPWPDFGETHLREALDAYAHRDRRFGGLTAAVR